MRESVASESVGGCTVVGASALPHRSLSFERLLQSARSGVTPTRAVERAAGGRVFRASTFPRTRVTRSPAETLHYPPAARRLRNRPSARYATSRDRARESVPRCAVTRYAIGFDRFRQSAMARNCLLRCADLSMLFFSRTAVRFA